MTEAPQRGVIEDDLWSWIDADDPVSDVPDIEPSSVVAVMVTHNAAEWLPRQLLSLAMLTTRPGRIVVVDTGSADDTPALVDRALDEGVVDEFIRSDDETSFGAAVHLALAESEPDWIWLLHDDSAPRKDALAELLDGARQSDIVVPKLLQPRRRNYPETLSEMGQAITVGGHRVPMVDEGDIDQGQTESRDVLGASTAGLLVRGGTWREIGGLAPEVERHRGGVDFCWRANAVGFRVLTWPDAALHHRRAGQTGERPGDEHPHVGDRLAALRIAGSRGASAAGLAAASILRSFGFLLGKSPSFAMAELKAWRRYRDSAEVTAALKTRLPEEDLTPPDLLPNRWWPVRHAADRLGNAISERYHELVDVPADTSIDELTGDDFAGRQIRRRVFSPVTALVLVLLLAALIPAGTLLLSGPASGGGLLPAPATLGAAWQAYLIGEAPWLGLAALAATLTFGSPGLLTYLLLTLTPLFAAVGALLLLTRLGTPQGLRVGIALAWAGATLLLGIVTAGDVTGMVLAVTGPLLARAIVDVVRDEAQGAEGLRTPAKAAFWLLIVAAVWPVALVLATLAGAFWAVRERSRVVDVALGLTPAWVSLLPWLPGLARHPGRLLTGVDPLAWPDYPPASYALLVGRILPSGFPVWVNVVFFTVLGLVALWMISRLPRRTWLITVTAIALPLVLGTVLSRFTVPVDGGTARILLSPWALLVVGALLAPVVLAERTPKSNRPVLLTLVLVGLLAVGTWGLEGFFDSPVRANPSVLPGYVRDVVHSPRDTRVLALERRGEVVHWNVIDARQPQWGTGERNPAGAFADHLDTLAQAISSGAMPDDLATRFRLLGVSHLWVRSLDPNHTVLIDNTEGLLSAASDDRSTVWTVSGLVSRVGWMDDELIPVTDAELLASDESRLLVVAAPSTEDWRATLDGRSLERTHGFSWELLGEEMVTFQAGPEGGELVVEPTPARGRLVVHLLVLLAVGLLAAPTLNAGTAAKRGRE